MEGYAPAASDGLGSQHAWVQIQGGARISGGVFAAMRKINVCGQRLGLSQAVLTLEELQGACSR